MEIRAEQFIDTVQTAALIVTAIAQIYTMLLLRNEIRDAARAMQSFLRRLERLEAKTGAQSSADGSDV
jgi:hypothetical protein